MPTAPMPLTRAQLETLAIYLHMYTRILESYGHSATPSAKRVLECINHDLDAIPAVGRI